MSTVSDGQVISLTMTRQRALELGLLMCACGHRPNNHFDHDKKPCAHCEKCDSYRERGVWGTKLVKD